MEFAANRPLRGLITPDRQPTAIARRGPVESIFFIAGIWLLISVIAAIISYHLDISIALVEICIGVAAAAVADHFFGQGSLGSSQQWLQFLASIGAVLLTFLAGAELDPGVVRTKLKEISVVGLVGFAAPFAGGTAVAHFILGWTVSSSFLGGIALSTTSMAVVYAVMLETGLNKTEYGKGILGACFVNDLGTVIALGLMFSPFTGKTLLFIGASAIVIGSLPTVTRFLTRIYGNRTAAIRTKWIVAVLLGLGALAYWSGSEAVLPAYVAGIVLAEFANAEHQWLRRLRTLTTGFLTPFYFIRAGSFVSVPALIAAPLAFLFLFLAKVLSKISGLYPVISRFRRPVKERWYYTLLMSTGLTFGSISALYGLTHGIITQAQYSVLIATVIGSAVIPTLIAGRFFLPRHLLAPAELAKHVVMIPEGSPADE
jgi:Kef-type K+ transport system membrane component KefB